MLKKISYSRFSFVKRNYLVEYKDLYDTLLGCGITLEEYEKMDKENFKLNLHSNFLILQCRKKHLHKAMKEIEEMLQERGNEVEVIYALGGTFSPINISKLQQYEYTES